MSNLSEEELSNRMILIINGLKECLDYNCNKRKENQIEIKYDIETLETMIDLYNKEKEKNKLLKSYSTNLPENVEMILLTKNDFERNISTDYISKDKIREKIKEYKKYDNGINYENEISVLQELLEERN